LIEENLPRGGFFVGGIPNQEPGGRGTPLQTPKIDQFWGLFFRGVVLPPGSWFGNHPTDSFPRRGGFLTIKYPQSVLNKNSIHDLMIIERKISFQEKLYSHRKI
jgi:hypothetical protein